MTHSDDLMAHPPTMAEMAGGVLDAEGNTARSTSSNGHDPALAVAAELAAEDKWTPSDVHAEADDVPAGLAALEAETEE